MHVTLAELRAAREWCETRGFLLTPHVTRTLGQLPSPKVKVSDILRSDLLAASWEVKS